MNNRYEFRENWQPLLDDPAFAILMMLAKVTDNPMMKAEVMTRAVSNFIYDTQEQRFLTPDEAQELMTGWIEAGQGNRILEGIENLAKGETVDPAVLEEKFEEEINAADSIDEEGLRNLFNLK